MEDGTAIRGEVGRELSRRGFLQRAGVLGAGALIVGALPVAERMLAADPALAAVTPDDATLQAFADTIVPGRRALRTDLGDEIHPLAIAAVDREPGGVEADALRVFKDPRLGFAALETPFFADLDARALGQGGPFLTLPFAKRTKAVLGGFDFGNPGRPLYEAAAAAVFAAFCAATAQPVGTSRSASGYRVMGYPGAAPNGYRDASYGRRLSVERTRNGSLP